MYTNTRITFATEIPKLIDNLKEIGYTEERLKKCLKSMVIILTIIADVEDVLDIFCKECKEIKIPEDYIPEDLVNLTKQIDKELQEIEK